MNHVGDQVLPGFKSKTPGFFEESAVNFSASTRPSKLLFLLVSMHTASCTTVDENAIQKRLESPVGQRFSQSRSNQPTAEQKVIREDGELTILYDLLWKNGCAYQIVARRAEDIKMDWRFISEEDLCKRVIRRPLES